MNTTSSISDSLRLVQKAMKTRRVALNMTQDEAAKRSGIAPGTLKRFERTGEISLERLICLMMLYDMDSRIIPHFNDMGYWTLEQIERADVRKKA